MATIINSSYTEGAVQQDGRRVVYERHEASDGRVFYFETLTDADAQTMLTMRAATLGDQLHIEADAQAAISGTLLPLTKLQFRRLLTSTELAAADYFNATFEVNELLTVEQKAMIRTGLENYKMAVDIPRPFDTDVQGMMGLYAALGIITAERAAEILAAGNG